MKTKRHWKNAAPSSAPRSYIHIRILILFLIHEIYTFAREKLSRDLQQFAANPFADVVLPFPPARAAVVLPVSARFPLRLAVP